MSQTAIDGAKTASKKASRAFLIADFAAGEAERTRIELSEVRAEHRRFVQGIRTEFAKGAAQSREHNAQLERSAATLAETAQRALDISIETREETREALTELYGRVEAIEGQCGGFEGRIAAVESVLRSLKKRRWMVYLLVGAMLVGVGFAIGRNSRQKVEEQTALQRR